MSAPLERPVRQRFIQTPAYLRAELTYATVNENAELFRALAVTCVERQISRVLVAAGDDDPANERALRDALAMMVLAGLAEGFRLAVVAASPRVAYAYRNFQRRASAAGAETRTFDREDDAVRWLEDAKA
jgi:hypothetical protein